MAAALAGAPGGVKLDGASRHCERSEAIQPLTAVRLDCVVAALLAMTRSEEHSLAKKLTRFILIALVLGIIAGWAINYAIDDGTPASAERLKSIADYLSIVTALFLRLIKMIIAPLVFSTLVAGIAHMGDVASLGRVGLRSLGWFILASLVSLTLGLILVNMLQSRRRRRPRSSARDGGAAGSKPRPSTSRISSPTSCPPRSSKRWRTTRSCRSSFSRSSSASR